MTPILGRVHSIRPSFEFAAGTRVLSESSPFIIGLFCGKGKPDDIDKFLDPTIDEFIRLSPETSDKKLIVNRVCTASLRCVISDTPMRADLKRSKGHGGYWACDRCIQKGVPFKGNAKNIVMENVDAPLRQDEDFLDYHVNDFSQDDHLDPTKESPFVRLNFQMVTGFIIDPMHSFIEGTLGRRIVGFASVPSEGKINKEGLAKANERIAAFKCWKVNDFDRVVGNLSNCGSFKMHVKRQFLYYHLFPVFEGILSEYEMEHVMMLQHAMMLLGSFDPHPVPEENIRLARNTLKMYCVELTEREIPCRFVNHECIHIPDDVAKYQCGVETLSAFQYESFLSFFRRCLKSGNLPLEQIRNRLVEKKKYQFATTSTGMIISNKVQLLLEAQRTLSPLGPIQFHHKGEKLPKKLIFVNFELLNRTPNNFCAMSDGSIIVCKDFVIDDNGSSHIIGQKFCHMSDAFVKPFRSSNFGIFLGTNLSEIREIWPASQVTAKIYAFPRRPNGAINIEDKEQQWFLIPLRHTIKKV